MSPRGGGEPVSPRGAAPHLSERAAAILRRVFAAAQGDFAFRLWDGMTVALGAGAPAFTVVFPTPEIFFRVMRDPTPLAFGEAYVDSAIDIEGDLFAAMHVANALEDIRLPLQQRLRFLLSMGPVALLPAKPARARSGGGVGPEASEGGAGPHRTTGAAVAPPSADR